MRLDEVGSTQDEARTRFDGTPVLVLAQRQNRGRGRHGRAWTSATRSLPASLAFSPAMGSRHVGPAQPGGRAGGLLGCSRGDPVKWPNDPVTVGERLAASSSRRQAAWSSPGSVANLHFAPTPPEGSAATARRRLLVLPWRRDRGPPGRPTSPGVEQRPRALGTGGRRPRLRHPWPRITWEGQGCGEGRAVRLPKDGLRALSRSSENLADQNGVTR